MYLMIARITKGEECVGFRLVDKETDKVINLAYKGVADLLKNNADSIENLEEFEGEILGKNGVLNRYTKIDFESDSVVGDESLVISKRYKDESDTTIGYKIYSYNGDSRKYKEEDTIKIGEANGIANAKIVSTDGNKFISAIRGEFKCEVIRKDFRNTRDKKIINDIAIRNEGVSTGVRRIASNTAAVISDDTEYMDTFGVLSAEQREAIKEYYLWYTVELFESIAGKNSQLKISAKKADKIAKIRQRSENWKFAGIVDTQITKENAHCEFGHAIRYKFYAIPDNEDSKKIHYNRIRGYGNTKEEVKSSLLAREQAMIDNGAIVFGEGCASDFFEINTEDMKKLIKVKNNMSEEIEKIIVVKNAGTDLVKKNWEKIGLISRLMDNAWADKNNRDKIVNMLGVNMAISERKFRTLDIPYTMSMTLYIADKMRSNSDLMYSLCFDKVTAEYIKSKTSYLKPFIEEDVIEGMYCYNPFNEDKLRKDKGGYNNSTRAAFERKISGVMHDIEYYSYRTAFDKIIQMFSYEYLENLAGFKKYKNGIKERMLSLNIEDYDVLMYLKNTYARDDIASINYVAKHNIDRSKGISEVEEFNYALNIVDKSIPNPYAKAYNGYYKYPDISGYYRYPQLGRIDKKWSFTNRMYEKELSEYVVSNNFSIDSCVENYIKALEWYYRDELEKYKAASVASNTTDSTTDTNNTSDSSTISVDTDDKINKNINETADSAENVSSIASATREVTLKDKIKHVMDCIGMDKDLLSRDRQVFIVNDMNKRGITTFSSKQEWTINEAYRKCVEQFGEPFITDNSANSNTDAENSNTDAENTNVSKDNIGITDEERSNAIEALKSRLFNNTNAKVERFKELVKKLNNNEIREIEVEELKELIRVLNSNISDVSDSSVKETIIEMYKLLA